MRCPVCRAENVEEATCRRCRADLTLLVALEEARRAALAKAARAAATGDAAGTLTNAEMAHRLRADADSACYLALGHLLNRDFAQALAQHQRASSS